MDTETARQSFDRLSVDTIANINEDISLASEISTDSRFKQSDSIISSLRTSIDGSPSYINNFNILKQGPQQEDEWTVKSANILGPNSIFDLTQALDSARIRSNKTLRSQVSLNGGTQTIHNLIKPSTKDIPPIQLQPLKQKVPDDTFAKTLIEDVNKEYKAFELSYNPLTADILSSFAQLYGDSHISLSQAGLSDEDKVVEEIPTVFKNPEFRLDDPRVFREVMQNSRILNDVESSDTPQLVDNFEVQEKLLLYLDSVEMQLISEISKTSTSFFTTLGDINTIKIQSKACVLKLQGIDGKLNLLEISQLKTGAEILNLLDESKSVESFETSLLQLRSILTAINEAHNFLEKGNNSACLNKICISEYLMKGDMNGVHLDSKVLEQIPQFNHSLVDLTSLPALKSSRIKLKELKERCSKSYVREFLDVLMDDVRSHYNAVPVRDSVNRMYITTDRSRKFDHSSLNGDYRIVSEKTKDLLRNFIRTLISSGSLTEAFSQYQDFILSEVKAIIRKGLPIESDPGPVSKIHAAAVDSQGSSNTSENDLHLSQENRNHSEPSVSKRATLSGNIKILSNLVFFDMVQEIFAHLSEYLRRLTTHQKLLLDLSLTSLSSEEAGNVDVMSLDISSSINRAIEITQVRLVKVLNVRLEQLGDLPVKEYLKIFLLISSYLLECESIYPGYNGSEVGRSLNEWLKNHVGYYIHRFHSNSVRGLISLCDQEIWKEYTGEEMLPTQELLDKIVSHANFVKNGTGFDGSCWSKLMLDLYQENKNAENKFSSEGNLPTDLPTRLTIDQEQFFVPRFITSVIRTTGDFIILSKVFGSRALSISQNLITYLKVSNSRISLAILNAGATRTAGLRHITTKHIALCIQTVDFLNHYSCNLNDLFKPVIELRDAQRDSQDQPNFDTLMNYFQEHKEELISKLVSIMHDRTLSHCNAIKKLDLSTPASNPQQCRPYMETLVKETLTVSKVIGRYLNKADCSRIMLRIFENYKQLLVKCYCAELPQLKDFNEKHTLLKDIDYFRVKLGEVEGYGNSGQIIWENVNSLPTVEDTTMEEKMRHTIETELDKFEKEDKKPNLHDEAVGNDAVIETDPETDLETEKTPGPPFIEGNKDETNESEKQIPTSLSEDRTSKMN